ncbi:hypothetical protein ACJX0J_024710, partial [Zea mays]
RILQESGLGTVKCVEDAHAYASNCPINTTAYLDCMFLIQSCNNSVDIYHLEFIFSYKITQSITHILFIEGDNWYASITIIYYPLTDITFG